MRRYSLLPDEDASRFAALPAILRVGREVGQFVVFDEALEVAVGTDCSRYAATFG
jgi:hypothetical protein